MRVVVQGDPSARSSAENKVIGLLRDWSGSHHLPGLCLVHVHVPTGHRTREVDGLLWTPHGLAVLEVKGFTTAQPGTLEIPANGPWRVQGQPAAVHTLTETTPAEQCQTGVYAVRNTLRNAGMDRFIAGLVALVHPNQTLQLGDTSRLPTGIAVALATRSDLRRWAHRQRERCSRPVWSADDVLHACAALDLTGLAPQRAELVADGFPDLITDNARARPHRPRPAQPSARPAAGQQTSTTGTTTRSSASSPFGPSGPFGTSPPARKPQPAAPPRPQPARAPARPAPPPRQIPRRTRHTTIASTAALVALLAGMLAVLVLVTVYL